MPTYMEKSGHVLARKPRNPHDRERRGSDPAEHHGLPEYEPYFYPTQFGLGAETEPDDRNWIRYRKRIDDAARAYDGEYYRRMPQYEQGDDLPTPSPTLGEVSHELVRKHGGWRARKQLERVLAGETDVYPGDDPTYRRANFNPEETLKQQDYRVHDEIAWRWAEQLYRQDPQLSVGALRTINVPEQVIETYYEYQVFAEELAAAEEQAEFDAIMAEDDAYFEGLPR